MKYVGARAANPPLGLLTVAAMLPEEWDKKLTDMNVHPLKDRDIQWADLVMLGAMSIQRQSTQEVVRRCKDLGVKIAAGGPLFTSEPDAIPGVDYLILNEGEVTLSPFLSDLARGCPQPVYTSNELPDLTQTPVPLWDLVKVKDYATISIQYSRGCPYDCEFCEITSLFGHKPRLKSAGQMLRELDALYEQGWRGTVFIVDDNFIGNKVRLKREILPAMRDWMEDHKYPFKFMTELSINLADDEELMTAMTAAGFNSAFIGIETPSEDSLKECNKFNNVNRNLLNSVKKIENFGFKISGGFIVGFDSDTPSIFDRQIKFIQESGIVTAMVGLLHAPVGTKLFQRLKKENRLLAEKFSGNNTDYSLNFIPRMNAQTLKEGYQRIVRTLYEPANYYHRVFQFFKEYRPVRMKGFNKIRLRHIRALFMSVVDLGIRNKDRMLYWKFLFKTMVKYPRFLPEAVNFAVYGIHFRKIFITAQVPEPE